MKRALDLTYFGSLIPICQLKEIANSYDDILLNIYKTRVREISHKKVSAVISKTDIKILDIWKKYKNSYKTKEEIEFIQEVGKKLKQTSGYLKYIADIYKSGSRKKIAKISRKSVKFYIDESKKAIQDVIKYEMSVAVALRANVRDKSERSKQALMYIFLLLLIITLVFYIPIIRSLENTQKELFKANRLLKEASIKDPLTDLYNRRFFELKFENELKRAAREGYEIAFMMLDIDYFKPYNDTYGHKMGDETLKAVANSLKEALKRPGDFIFRLGGEEFGVSIAPSSLEDAKSAAQRIMKIIEEKRIEHKGSKVKDIVSISIGVLVCCPPSDIEPNDIVKRADKLLYKAKELGRDRAIVEYLS
jgi:diguanylate cyclase (GGDEF)-like protein